MYSFYDNIVEHGSCLINVLALTTVCRGNWGFVAISQSHLQRSKCCQAPERVEVSRWSFVCCQNLQLALSCRPFGSSVLLQLTYLDTWEMEVMWSSPYSEQSKWFSWVGCSLSWWEVGGWVLSSAMLEGWDNLEEVSAATILPYQHLF